MKYFRYLILVCVLFLIVGCSKENIGIDKINLNGKTIVLKPDDVVSVDYWNNREIYYNDEAYDSVPIFYKNIRINDSIKDIIDKLEIKSGYALINSEISTEEHDGTTNIVNIEYKDINSFDFDYLDACLIVAYQKNGFSWKMLDFDQIQSLANDDSILKDVILYKIDFNGFDDEAVDIGHVISISIEYLS